MSRVSHNGIVCSAHELRPGCLVRVSKTPELNEWRDSQAQAADNDLTSRTFMVDKRYLPQMGLNSRVYLRDLTDDKTYEGWYDPIRLTRISR